MQAADTISIELMPLDASAWQMVPEGTPAPLQQHPSYGKAMMAAGAQVSQLMAFRNDRPIALGLVLSRRFAGVIRFSTLMRGPLWLEVSLTDADKGAVFKALRRTFNPWRWNFLGLQPELADGADTTKLMRGAGYRRVMTGYATAWLDLSPDEATLRATLDAKWRNKLGKADGCDISIGGKRQPQYEWLLEREREQAEARGYVGLPPALIIPYATSLPNAQDAVLSVTAIKGRDKLAGALFLIHGASATYQIGHLTDAGREVTGLHNEVLWHGILALKAKGIRFLDLGGFDTQDRIGITRFKLGLGAKPVGFTGTWV